MASIITLAAEYNTQPYELATFLDLDADFDEFAELDEATEAEIREILAYDVEHNQYEN